MRALFWPDQPRGGRVALWTGRVGFALFALALFVGMFTSAASATSYVTATTATSRQAIALDYAGRYALETLLSRVLGGIGVTVFLVIISLRMVRTRAFPLWFAYLGIVCAALMAATALLFALGPAQATTPTSGLAFVLLALWLILAGVLLVRLKRLPAIPGSAAVPPPASPTRAQ